MKKIFTLLIVSFLLIGVVFAGGQQESEDSGAGEKGKSLKIGYVIPYEIGYFAYYLKGMELVFEEHNVESVRLYNNYEAEKEIAAVQDLIAMGVDAIHIVSPSPDSAQYACQLANEAGIPIQVSDSPLAPGKGEAIANVDFSWYEIYESIIENLEKSVPGEKKIMNIQGFAGSGPVELGIQAMNTTADKYSDIEIVSLQYGDYRIDKSLNITQDMLQAGLDFNVTLGSCQEITEGILQALLAENADLDKIEVVTVNGGPMDIENFQKGYIDYALSHSPGLHGMIGARNLIAYLNGETYQTEPRSPFAWASKDDWQKTSIPWDIDHSWLPVVDEFVKSGHYKRELLTN